MSKQPQNGKQEEPFTARLAKINDENFEFNSEEEWINLRCGISGQYMSSYEYQAYEFAGRFLVPIDKLIEELEKNRKKIESFITLSPHYNVDELIAYVSSNISDGGFFNETVSC